MPGCHHLGVLSGKPFFPNVKNTSKSVLDRLVQVEHVTDQGVAGFECRMSDMEELARKLGAEGGVVDVRASLKLADGEEEEVLIASTCSPVFEWSSHHCDRVRRRGR